MTTSGAGATTVPALLRIAEDELQQLRGHMAANAAFNHDPAHDLSARSALAQLLTLPQPTPTARAAAPTLGHDPLIPSPRPPSTTEPTTPPSRKDPAHEHAHAFDR